MKKSNMRSMSETRLGKIIASHWMPFEEQGIKFKVNVMLREYAVNEEIRRRVEHVVLIEFHQDHPRQIIHTDFGPTCGVCLTSDHIKEDKKGNWFEQVSQGFTCTRCDASTLVSNA